MREGIGTHCQGLFSHAVLGFPRGEDHDQGTEDGWDRHNDEGPAPAYLCPCTMPPVHKLDKYHQSSSKGAHMYHKTLTVHHIWCSHQAAPGKSTHAHLSGLMHGSLPAGSEMTDREHDESAP